MANRMHIRPLHILQQVLIKRELDKSKAAKRKKRRRKKTKSSKLVRHVPTAKGARY